MSEEQKIIPVDTQGLVGKAQELKASGFRLVQIGCTRLDQFELNYSFDKDYEFINLRLVVPSNDQEIPSISGVYLAAFLYENELHDLFGLKIKNIAVDYQGNFYRTAIKWPFSEQKPKVEKEKGPEA